MLDAPPFATIAALTDAGEDAEMCGALRSALHVSAVPAPVARARGRPSRVARGSRARRCRAGASAGGPAASRDAEDAASSEPAPSSSYGAAMQSVNVAVLSNSAGLKQFDPTGAVADAMEASLGIGFLRHSSKKPSGSCVALEERFKCAPKDMVMLGDRYLTDVVYGNRHGMFTVRCAPFTDAGESASIRAAKTIEEIAVAWWRKPDGSKKPERCPGKKPHENVPEGKDASHFVASPGVW